jgi:hypothetical protein
MSYDPVIIPNKALAVDEFIDQNHRLAHENRMKHRIYSPKWSKDGTVENLRFSKLEYLKLLHANGFQRLVLSVESRVFIRTLENKSVIIEEEDFAQFMYNYIRTELDDIEHKRIIDNNEVSRIITKDFIQECFLNNLDNLIKSKIHSLLKPNFTLKFIEDNKLEKFFFFRNTIVRVSKANGIEQIPYQAISDSIWQESVISHNFKSSKSYQLCYWARFIHNICRVCLPDGSLNQQDTGDRVLSLQTLIGYAMHFYFGGKLRAPILTDSTITDSGAPNGRTGKSLIIKGIQKMLNASDDARIVTELNGKNFNFNNPNRYDRANVNTRLLVLNDVERNFQLENLFNDITDGAEIKKLYKSPFKLFVKVILTTNLSIRTNGDSAKDRVIFFELSDYYRAGFSPGDEFKHWFFDDWDELEFNEFYNYMIHCVYKYLQFGLIEAKSLTIQTRTIREHTSDYFYRWINTLVSGKFEDGELLEDGQKLRINPSNRVNKDMYKAREFFDKFINENPEAKEGRPVTQYKFNRWIDLYMDSINARVEKFHKRDGDYYAFIFKK